MLSYPWEFLQVPFYQSMPSASHWSGVVICSTAALGDAIVMLVAFWLTALVARSGRWVVEPRAGHVALFVATGLLLTVVIEHVAVRSQWGWRYEPNMLVIPLLGTGLAPVLQWLILPPLTVWFVRRQVIGAQHVLAAERAHEADSHRK